MTLIILFTCSLACSSAQPSPYTFTRSHAHALMHLLTNSFTRAPARSPTLLTGCTQNSFPRHRNRSPFLPLSTADKAQALRSSCVICSSTRVSVQFTQRVATRCESRPWGECGSAKALRKRCLHWSMAPAQSAAEDTFEGISMGE